MSWLNRYHLKNYLKTSIWILPAIGMLAAMAAVRILNGIEIEMGWKTGFDTSTSMTVMGTLAASMFTLVIFVCSALLISVQLASASLSPRFIGLVFQNRVIKYTLTLFMFTFAFTLAALLRINKEVPLLTAYIACYSCVVSLGVFIYMVDEVGKALRPSGALKLVVRLGKDVIKNVYPNSLSDPRPALPEPANILQAKPLLTLLNQKEGVVLAFDIEGLVSTAHHYGCVIEMVPQVGDFIGAEQPLFRIYGNGETPQAALLYASVAVGTERTLQQDPGFALRIMVDIASKALSPAINDPTTAVLAIDQIQYLLRLLGSRHLDEGVRTDSTGTVRLVYRTPDWEDFIGLAVTEIRQFGGTSIQIARRMRAMLETLISTLPAERSTALHQELSLLNRSSKRFFPDAEDQAMADVSDFQGVGGRRVPH